MNEETYLRERLDDQIEWYGNKSGWHQKWYKRLRTIEIAAAAAIPFLTGYITDASPGYKAAVGLLGVLIAVVSGVMALFKYQEHWLQYRTTAESLKHHRYLYLTKTAPYDRKEAFKLLVESVEGLISRENSNWFSYVKGKAGIEENVGIEDRSPNED